MSLNDLRVIRRDIGVAPDMELPDRDEDFDAYMAAIFNLIPKELTHADLTEYDSEIIDGVEVKYWNKDLHTTRIKSFKVGAFLAMWKLKKKWDEEGVTDGVIVAASAGNHAQGVAVSAAALGMKAIIYMPKGTSPAKIDGTKKFGKGWVEIREEGDGFAEAKKLSEAHIASSEKAVSIPPYADPDIIDGQGVHLYEIFKVFEREEVLGRVNMVLMGVGGGGLLAGSMQVRERLSPETVIVAAEQFGAHCAKVALDGGDESELTGNAFAAGTNVRILGKINEEIIRILRKEEDLFEVINNGELAVLTDKIKKETGYDVETAAVLGHAALLYRESVRVQVLREVEKAKAKGETVVNVVNLITGGNITFHEQVMIEKEAEIYSGRRKYLDVEIPNNQPGELRNLLRAIKDRGVDIVEFKYSSHYRVSDQGGQVVKLGLSHSEESSLEGIVDDISKYRVNDITRYQTKDLVDCLDEVPPQFKDEPLAEGTEKPPYREFELRIPKGHGSLLNLLDSLIEKLGFEPNIEFFDYAERHVEDHFTYVKLGFNVEQITKVHSALSELCSEVEGMRIDGVRDVH